jgi:hypothetical protein
MNWRHYRSDVTSEWTISDSHATELSHGRLEFARRLNKKELPDHLLAQQ